MTFAEIKYLKPENEHSQKVRTYFNFLDKIIGRGLFLIFLACLIMNNAVSGGLEYIVAIIAVSIGIIDIILGWGEDKHELPSAPWGKKEEAKQPAKAVIDPSSAQNQANSENLKAAYA